jgi:amylosucrase
MKKTAKARLKECYDELKWLYMELYSGDEQAFSYFLEVLMNCRKQRKQVLKERDKARMEDPDWYRAGDLLGMMMYVDKFAGTLKGVQEKLPYLLECGVNYLHLMPLLSTVKGRSDGGYAVADFRSVQEELGTMEDLSNLADLCHENGISLCLDFVMNHTSADHAWAKAAREGDTLARNRYYFYDNWDIPSEIEKTVPDVFPTTAPGNFTWYDDCKKVVMTMFYPYQWDLNYHNPMVLNDMTENLLFLANRGVDVLRLDAIPYIWKEIGSDNRNLPQVHTIARILHLACYVVCPSVILLGEVVMEPYKVAAYFGTVEKPECQLLYNVTTMCTTWHTLATRDVRLLRSQMDQTFHMPKNAVFQNYLRCHDDIGWGLDYFFLGQFGIQEVSHKRFLNDWFTGRWPGSCSRGELYNEDLRLGDARLCGTTASLCGLETADDPLSEEAAINRILMLHAFMMTQSGIPVLYSGDEIGQLNDYRYHEDPDIWDDSRYVHRGAFDWEAAKRRNDPDTREGKVFQALRRIEKIRAAEPVFRVDASGYTFDTGSNAVLGVYREYNGTGLTAFFNFSDQQINVPYRAGKDLITGEDRVAGLAPIEPYAFSWIRTGKTDE